MKLFLVADIFALLVPYSSPSEYCCFSCFLLIFVCTFQFYLSRFFFPHVTIFHINRIFSRFTMWPVFALVMELRSKFASNILCINKSIPSLPLSVLPLPVILFYPFMYSLKLARCLNCPQRILYENSFGYTVFLR